MAEMADFTVAYENLLRDGQCTTENRVEIADYKTSKDGQSDTIWTYTRSDLPPVQKIIHCSYRPQWKKMPYAPA